MYPTPYPSTRRQPSAHLPALWCRARRKACACTAAHPASALRACVRAPMLRPSARRAAAQWRSLPACQAATKRTQAVQTRRAALCGDAQAARPSWCRRTRLTAPCRPASRCPPRRPPRPPPRRRPRLSRRRRRACRLCAAGQPCSVLSCRRALQYGVAAALNNASRGVCPWLALTAAQVSRVRQSSAPPDQFAEDSGPLKAVTNKASVERVCWSLGAGTRCRAAGRRGRSASGGGARGCGARGGAGHGARGGRGRRQRGRRVAWCASVAFRLMLLF